MRYCVIASMMFCLISLPTLAAVFVDPLMGNSPTAATNDKDRAAAAKKVDPVLGDSPVARAEKPKPERKSLAPATQTAPHKPHYQHPHHGHITHYYVPESSKGIYPITRSYSITSYGKDNTATIDGQSFSLINRWHGKCGGRNCSVSAGFLTSTPEKGAIIVMNPHLHNGPMVYHPSSETGALRITGIEKHKGLLTITSHNNTVYRFNLPTGDWEF